MRSFISNAIRPTYEKLNYKKCLAKAKLQKSEIIILATIPKTGTHLLRFLLATYCKLMTENQQHVLGLAPMEVDKYFPSSWHTHYQNILPLPVRLDSLNVLNIKDLPRTHSVYKKIAWDGTRVIHTYRNPLDYVDTHHFAKNRMDPRGNAEYELSASVREALPRFIQEYMSFLDAPESLVKRISFEDLVSNPRQELQNLLEWMGAKIDDTKIGDAVKLVFEEYPWCVVGAGEKWQRNGDGKDCHLADQFLQHSYKLNGIGVWKKYLSVEDLEYVKIHLEQKGISTFFDLS